MSHRCQQCTADIAPGPQWMILEDAYRRQRYFCSALCLYRWIAFFITPAERSSGESREV